MTNAEEQDMEIEALEALFPDEMRRLVDSYGSRKIKFTNLLPFSDKSQVNYVCADVEFVFPSGYPLEDQLQFAVVRTTGPISNDSSKQQELREVIESEININAGTSCVYQVVERIIEWLKENNAEEMSLFDQMKKSAGGTGAISRRNMVSIADDQYDDSDSEYDGEFSDFSDESFYSSEDSENENQEFQGLQVKDLCAEADRVSPSQFEEWRVGYEKWLLATGAIKRSGDVRKSGKEQFVELLASRHKSDAATTGSVARTEEASFDPSLFAQDLELDDDEEY